MRAIDGVQLIRMVARPVIVILLMAAGILTILSVPFPMTVTRTQPVEYATVTATTTTMTTGVRREILTIEAIYSWTKILTSTTSITETKFLSLVESQTGNQYLPYVLLVTVALVAAFSVKIWRRH